MSFKAGQRPTNPFTGSKEPTHEMKRDSYLNSLEIKKKRRLLTGEEKQTAEKMLEVFIKNITRGANE